MKQYLDLCQHILDKGNVKDDRTGTGVISTFGYQMRFNLEEGFPLLTTKKMHLRSIIYELLWFLNGDTDIKYLLDNNVNIWNGDAYRNFKNKHPELEETQQSFIENIAKNIGWDLGPVYGKQWRSWTDFNGKIHDQILNVIEQIYSNPNSRRLIVNAWNVGDLDKMTLPPCHVMFQFYVNDGKLSCQLYQRSGDVFLGVPFNIASYALLTMMIAQQCNLGVGEFIHTLGDAHIYKNHIDQVKLQLSRTPKKTPTMIINKASSISNYKYEDFKLENYESYPTIKGELSVGE